MSSSLNRTLVFESSCLRSCGGFSFTQVLWAEKEPGHLWGGGTEAVGLREESRLHPPGLFLTRLLPQDGLVGVTVLRYLRYSQARMDPPCVPLKLILTTRPEPEFRLQGLLEGSREGGDQSTLLVGSCNMEYCNETSILRGRQARILLQGQRTVAHLMQRREGDEYATNTRQVGFRAGQFHFEIVRKNKNVINTKGTIQQIYSSF